MNKDSLRRTLTTRRQESLTPVEALNYSSCGADLALLSLPQTRSTVTSGSRGVVLSDVYKNFQSDGGGEEHLVSTIPIPIPKVPEGHLSPGFAGIKFLEDWFDPNLGEVRMIPSDERTPIPPGKGAPFTSIVRILSQYKPNGYVILGTGTLITPRLILTAAHVVLDPSTDNTGFFPKIHVRRYGVDIAGYPVHKIHVSPGYLAGRPFAVESEEGWNAILRHDYALIETCIDVLPAGELSFEYAAPNHIELENNPYLHHLGFTANYGPFPCRDEVPVLLKKEQPTWLGFPFGACTGKLYAQSDNLLDSAQPHSLNVFFDVVRGHSGGPIYAVKNGQRVIWGHMVSARQGRFEPNRAHRLTGESVGWIDQIVDSVKGSPTCVMGALDPLGHPSLRNTPSNVCPERSNGVIDRHSTQHLSTGTQR